MDARHADYLSRDPIFRSHHHTDLTFRGLYAWTENYCLPLSHDEVVHGKRSLLEKMPGDDWQKFANLRLLFVSQFAQTGKKLLFMGAEIAQRREWNHSIGVDWHLRQFAAHAGVERLVADLCRVYRDEPALHTLDCDPAGFEWIEANDWQGSTLAFLRKDDGDEMVLVVLNATPVPRYNYRVGVPEGGDLDRDPQQRCPDLRRQRPRQPGRGRGCCRTEHTGVRSRSGSPCHLSPG